VGIFINFAPNGYGMNFLSHYYLDRHRENSFFCVGVCTPDLVSIFDRRVRLKAHTLPDLSEGGVTSEQLAFHEGIMRHLEVDRIFHASDFFHKETSYFSRQLRANFGSEQVSRGFFVSHILLELLLDKILMEREPHLLENFYRRLTDPGLQFVVSLTEWAVQRKLPRYGAFYENFVVKKYLYRYTNWDNIIFVLEKILERVGITRFAYLHSPQFLDLGQTYQEELSARCFSAFDSFIDQLGGKATLEP
jgi:acyl carrier protein phosphodiesterase